jgi:hypothetical protein
LIAYVEDPTLVPEEGKKKYNPQKITDIIFVMM